MRELGTRGCRTRAFHLRAICPEGAGRSAVARSATAVKRDDFLNIRARQVQTLVLQRPRELEHLLHELTHRTAGDEFRRLEAKSREQGARARLETAVGG